MLPLHGGGFWVALLQLSVFYYVCGAILHWLVPALLPVKNIQPKQRNDGEVLRDALYSVGPIIVKAGIWTLVEHMHRGGITQLYVGSFTTWSDVVYLLFQIAFLDCVHDTWFYWTHRLLHWKPLYRHIHYIHHKSNAPSAFTGYSFHIVEALIVFANEILVCWMLPLHASVHRLYHIFTTLIHLGGHAGYEIAPFIPSVEALFCLFLGQRGSHTVLNTVQHHDLHHRYPTKHFSLYFTHWDRLMGTLHPGYDATLFSYFSHSKAG